MGCHSPSPTVPSSLFASFPLLTEKEARGSPRNGNYRRNFSGETPGKGRGRQGGTSAGEAGGCVVPESSMSSTISSAVVAHDGVSGEMVRQRDRRTAQVTTRQLTGKREGGESQFSTLTSNFSSHLHRAAQRPQHARHNRFQMRLNCGLAESHMHSAPPHYEHLSRTETAAQPSIDIYQIHLLCNCYFWKFFISFWVSSALVLSIHIFSLFNQLENPPHPAPQSTFELPLFTLKDQLHLKTVVHPSSSTINRV